MENPFSESVAAAAATIPVNYAIAGVTVTRAALHCGALVTLATDSLITIVLRTRGSCITCA